jgi:putative metalloprotease
MKKSLFFLLLIVATLSSCEVLNNVAGNEIANVISENLTEQITSRVSSVDPDAVAAAANSLASAITISNNEIVALCHEHMEEMDTTNIVLPDDDPYSQRLTRVMSRFKNLKGMRLNYAVYDDENTINAFASGDGSVRVYSGLMDLMDDDELFAVIGHELGHLNNHDVRDAYRTAYLVVAARYGIASFGERANALSMGFLGDLGDELANNAYSRHQENKADEAAYRFCIDNNVDPYAMYHALQKLDSVSGDQTGKKSGFANMFSSHPDTLKRIKHIKELAEKDGHVLED